jgi:hypothetical protein
MRSTDHQSLARRTLGAAEVSAVWKSAHHSGDMSHGSRDSFIAFCLP